MLIKLMCGVRQFQKEPFKDMETMFKQLSTRQNPDILFITCSDSRVIPDLLTQSKPGDLFIIRNVGNIIPPHPTVSSEAAGIEYALKVLQVEDIIICGHSDCGAIKGLLAPNLENQLPAVSSWVAHSHSVLKEMEKETKVSGDLASKVVPAIKKNVLAQLENLQTYPLVAEKLASKEITLHGWFYELESGDVYIYEPQHKDFIKLENAFQLAIEERRKKIVTEIAMNYLAQFTNPQTAQTYQFVVRMFSLLTNDLKAIWPLIKESVKQRLEGELGGLYTNSLDPEFINMVELGCEIKLNNLKAFQQNIVQSRGYHQFCSQLIRHSWFSQQTPASTIADPATSNCLNNYS